MRSSSPGPDIALEQRATFDAIAGMPDEFRAALVAVDIVGVSYREAAGVPQTREATIASRLFRARQAVARALSGESTAPTGKQPA